MSENYGFAQVRLKCLELANVRSGSAKEVIDRATEYEKFVTGKEGGKTLSISSDKAGKSPK